MENLSNTPTTKFMDISIHGIGDVSKILVAIPLPHDLNKFFERLKLGIQGFFFFLHSLEFEGEVGKMEYDFSKFVEFGNLEACIIETIRGRILRSWLEITKRVGRMIDHAFTRKQFEFLYQEEKWPVLWKEDEFVLLSQEAGHGNEASIMRTIRNILNHRPVN